MASHEAEIADVLDCCRTACRKGYRTFLEEINTAVTRLVTSEGRDMAQRYITVGAPMDHHHSSGVGMMAMALLTPRVPGELQKRLWKVIGFEDLGDDLMYLSNYEESRAFIDSFRGIVHTELEISGGDPAALKSLQERADTPSSVVAYLSYHLFIGVNMRVMHLKGDSLQGSFTDVLFSAEAVEKATHRLGIMAPNSESRTVWNEYKRQAVLRVETMNESLKERIDETCLILKGLFLSELTHCGSVSERLVDLWQYGQNVDFLLGKAYIGGDVDSTDASVCLDTSQKFGENAFTQEYMDLLRAVRNILRTAGQRSLSDDEIFDMNTILKWQSEHFLTCFCPEAFDDQWTSSCETGPSHPVVETMGDVDPREDSSDEEEKSDQPEKEFTLHASVAETHPQEQHDQLEVDHFTSRPSCLTVSGTVQETEGTGKSRRSPIVEVTTDKQLFSDVCQSLTQFNDTVLRLCLKETLDLLKTSDGEMTDAAVSVMAFLCAVEIVPLLCDALD